MPTITIDNFQIEYSLKIDKRRKTIGFLMRNCHQLYILTPVFIPKKNIEILIYEQQFWIKQQISKFAASTPSLTNGFSINLLGTPRTIVLIPKNNSKTDFIIHTNSIIIHYPHTLDIKQIEVLLKKCLFAYAEQYLKEKTKHFSNIIKVNPKHITLRDQKTRWGSCSSAGNINYNWRIIMAPENIINYLVIHELCHLVVPNHSQKFWQKVSEFYPDYKLAQYWLKQNSHTLTTILNS